MATIDSIRKVPQDEANLIGLAPMMASGLSRRTRQSTKKTNLSTVNEVAILGTSISSAIKDLV